MDNLPDGVSEGMINKAYSGHQAEDFADRFDDWSHEWFGGYLKRSVNAYAQLIELLGEVGKALPIDPDNMTGEQYEIAFELAYSQTYWLDAFRQYEYERHQERYDYTQEA